MRLARQAWFDLFSRTFCTSSPRGKQRLLILGSGWGGYTLLQGVDKRRWDATLLSPTSCFISTLLLPGCTVGTLVSRCPVPSVSSYSFIDIPLQITYQAWCDEIAFIIPEVKENALFLKDVKDARILHSRILECLEQANQRIISDDEKRRLPNFCIVGSGPTRVEFAAELYDLLPSEIAEHFPAPARFAKINLYDVAPRILAGRLFMTDRGVIVF
ncbi:putative NADH dehydrogenase [Termitomyces sp. J132]|nr:putative NADH dehydrogenase [Termitomyces sp. J132]